jgi:hypothetical protein
MSYLVLITSPQSEIDAIASGPPNLKRSVRQVLGEAN